MLKLRNLALALLLTVGATVAAQQPPPREEKKASESTEVDQRAEMRREVEEAARAINAYTVARRAAAVQRAQQAMDAMDRRLRQLQADWSAEAKRIGEDVQANRERALAEARERRAVLERRYHEMQQSSAQAWEGARAGFVRAYRDLAATLSTQRPKPEDAQPEEDETEVDKPNAP
ncbi:MULTISPECIES: hypothetical protein [unclassified Lysobacter]|uniref:hypothetical protein n=1 Tax=unclassified Lysobacter TaxID=2635362 RepID=UPI000ADB3EF7|nr:MULTISPECIES: hypothetical protein [unclassified Lysobacter]